MSELNSNSSSFFLPAKKSSKKTLVLDLDETLVHSQFLPFPIKSDIIFNISIENKPQDIHVLIRPGVQFFLEKLSKLYEIVIFTASVSKYANTLLDILDKDNHCSFRLFREHCSMMGLTYIKNLDKLGRDLKDVIIVDNSALSYSFNKENGIPILTWFCDKTDKELYKLLPVLEFLSDVNDIRDYIKDFVINDKISYENVINLIQNYSLINKDKEKQCKKYINDIIENLNLNNSNNNSENNNNNKMEKNEYINITISNNEINNYLYFSPIYTINNNIIKNANNNESIISPDIKTDNNPNNNQKEIKDKIISVNTKIERHKSKEVFNKIEVKGKNKTKTKAKKGQQKTIVKNNQQKNIKIKNIANITNKSINYALSLNNKNSKDNTQDKNIIDLKTLISYKKNKIQNNFKLPKTPEIEQILYNTNNNSKKSINGIFINKIINQQNKNNNTNKEVINNNKNNKIGKYHFRNNINKLKQKLNSNIFHEKHKSFNYTDLNFNTNFMTLKNNNLTEKIFNDTKYEIYPKNGSYSKHKISGTVRATKTLNSENMKLKYSLNSFHKKALSNQFKIIGISTGDKTTKTRKSVNFNLQITTTNSKRNTNKIRKINVINKTLYDNNMPNYSLKKIFNMSANTSKKNNQLNKKRILFNPIFIDEIKKPLMNIKDFTDFSNTLRHKKTLSFNGDIIPLQLMNRTSSSSMSKRILRERSGKLSKNNKIDNKNKIKAIKINVNDLQKKKLNKIKKIEEIKFIKIYENPKNKFNTTDITNNIILNKLFENGNKLKKAFRISNGVKKGK